MRNEKTFGVVLLIFIVLGALLFSASSRGFTLNFIGGLESQLDDLSILIENVNSSLYDMIVSVNDTLYEHIEEGVGVGVVLFGFNPLLVGTTNRYWGLNSDTTKTVESEAETSIIAGNFTKMIVNVVSCSFDYGGTITLRVNGVTSALSVTFATVGIYTDTDVVSVVEYDLVNFVGVGAMSGTAKVLVCLVFEPS